MDQLLMTIAISIVIVGFAIALAIYVIRHYIIRSITWKRAEGRITYAEMETSPRSGKTGTKLYGARISYEYQVGGKTYHGTQIRPDYIYTNQEAFHREILRRYREGRKINVYYNPKNPTQAFLELGIPKILLILIALSVVFMLAVFILLTEMVASLQLELNP